MKKLLLTMAFVVTFFAMSAVSASALANDTVKVGLRYGETALFSANLENYTGSGYTFGYYDDERVFVPVGTTAERAISMTAAGDIYLGADGTYNNTMVTGNDLYLGPWHVQVDGVATYEEALMAAEQLGGYPAWIDFGYAVRIGSFTTPDEAVSYAEALGGGTVVQSSSTGIVVTATRTDRILFEFDCSGVLSLGVMPDGQGEEAVTWFKGYRYPGGFEYPRVTGGNLHVYNVVDLESYVKGVIPYEMNNSWPMAALEAQAVCARTYACRSSKHLSAYGFDVCNTTDCQVYYGYSGNGSNGPNARTNAAVDHTCGELLYYRGDMVQNAVYHSSNGGATEDVANVWGSVRGYLVGKEDPYEAQTTIPSYNWTVTYTADELTWILSEKGYSIGRVKDVSVSEYTPMGNVKKITFVGTGGTKTVSGETCRTIFYSSSLGKSVKSMRFGINGSMPGGEKTVYYINGEKNTVNTLEGVSVLSGSGMLGKLEGDAFTVLTSSGTTKIENNGTGRPSVNKQDGVFVIEGVGSGHNLGMSQYGARAMAELGYSYQEILQFYYTDITIE